MGKAKALPRALPVLLLAALVLMSCLATSSSNCIPRRLLMVSGSYYRTVPCNDDVDRPTPRDGGGGGSDDGKAKLISGSRMPRWPPPPTGGTHPGGGHYRSPED